MAFPNLISPNPLVAFNSFSSIGPYQFGANLYVVCITQAPSPSPSVHMFKSVNNGATWSEVDLAHAPLCLQNTTMTAACSDGVSKVYVHTIDSVSGLKGQISIFDTTSDSWSGTFVATFFETINSSAAIIFRASDSKIIIATCVESLRPASGRFRCGYYTFDTAAHTFSAATAIGFVGEDAAHDWFCSAVVRGTGRVHFIMTNGAVSSGVSASGSTQQQALSDAGALGVLQAVSPNSAQTVSMPAASSDGTTILLCFFEYTGGPPGGQTIRVYKGASADPIVFTLRTLSIAPFTFASSFAGQACNCVFRNGVSSVVCLCTNDVVTFFLVLFQDSGAGFGAIQTIGSAAISFNNVFAASATSGIAVTMQSSAWFWLIADLAPVSSTSPGIGKGGNPPTPALVKAAKSKGPKIKGPGFDPSGWPLALPPDILHSKQFSRNGFDLCLARDWIDIDRRDNYAFSCPKPAQCYLSDPPWIVMPAEGKKFKPVGTLAVAGNFTGLDIAVVQLIVDKGYDGVITDIVAQLSSIGATGFAEGSGDVTFRLQQNLRWSRDLGNVKVSLGSMLSPGYSGLNRIRLFSGQLITIYVNLTVAAAARINPNAVVICSLNGYMYPRV